MKQSCKESQTSRLKQLGGADDQMNFRSSIRRKCLSRKHENNELTIIERAGAPQVLSSELTGRLVDLV